VSAVLQFKSIVQGPPKRLWRRESNPQEQCHSALENKAFDFGNDGVAADWQRKFRHSEEDSENSSQSMLDLATVVAAWHQLPRATQQIIAALVRESDQVDVLELHAL
jgi:hypothetical protein